MTIIEHVLKFRCAPTLADKLREDRFLRARRESCRRLIRRILQRHFEYEDRGLLLKARLVLAHARLRYDDAWPYGERIPAWRRGAKAREA